MGSDILFRAGAYQPQTLVGQHAFLGRKLHDAPAAFVQALQDKAHQVLMGVLGPDVRAILGGATDTPALILKDPLTFLNNLGLALKNGFDRVKQDLRGVLQGGLMSWLSGSLGVTIPDGAVKFDVAGIITLGLNALHLGYDALRKAVVTGLSAKGVKDAATVVGRLETGAAAGFTLLQTIRTKGLAGAWDALTAQVGDGLGAALDGAKAAVLQWVEQRVVQGVIAQLVALCTPVGDIVELLLTIYKAVQFFLDKMRALGQFMATLKDVVTRVATGDVWHAGAQVYNAVVASVPLLLGFIASLLGLGDVGKPVRAALAALTAPIRRIEAKLVALIVGKGQALAAALHGPGKGAPQAKDAAPPGQGAGHTDNPKHAAIAQAIVAKLEHIDGAPKDFAATRTEKEGEAGPLKARYQPQLERGINLSITFAITPDDAGGKEALDFTVTIAPNTTTLKGRVLVAAEGAPPTQVTYQTLSGNRAHWVQALPLTLQPGNTKGSAPYQSPPGWGQVVIFDHRRLNGTREPPVYGPLDWEQLHLLSEMFHGPGAAWNLVPGRKADNNWMTRNAEHDVKSAFDAERHATLSYKTEATYFAASDGDNDAAQRVTIEAFVKTIHIEWSHVKQEHGVWIKDTSRSLHVYDRTLERPPTLLPPPNMIPAVNINATGWEGLRDRLGLTPSLAQNIAAVRNGKLYFAPGATEGRFIDWADFLRRMTAFYKAKGIDFVHREDLWPTINERVAQRKVTL